MEEGCVTKKKVGSSPAYQPVQCKYGGRVLLNYFFFYNQSYPILIEELKSVLRDNRESIVVATGSESRNLKTLNSYLDQIYLQLEIDTVDIFYAEYVSPGDDLGALLGTGVCLTNSIGGKRKDASVMSVLHRITDQWQWNSSRAGALMYLCTDITWRTEAQKNRCSPQRSTLQFQ